MTVIIPVHLEETIVYAVTDVEIAIFALVVIAIVVLIAIVLVVTIVYAQQMLQFVRPVVKAQAHVVHCVSCKFQPCFVCNCVAKIEKLRVLLNHDHDL